MSSSDQPQFVTATWRRLLAHFIDRIIMVVMFLPVMMPLKIGQLMSEEPVSISWKILIGCLLLHIFYQWTFYKIMGGTIGKLIMGLRLVNRNTGGDLTRVQALVRVLCDLFSFLFGDAFKVLIFFRFDRTHPSDWVAETQVRQFSEQSNPPRRRPVLATILFFSFFINGFYSTYLTFHKVQIEGSNLVFYPSTIDE